MLWLDYPNNHIVDRTRFEVIVRELHEVLVRAGAGAATTNHL